MVGVWGRMDDILHANTRPRTSTERNEIFTQLSFVRLEPSFWLEGAGVWEQGGVVVEHD